MLEGREAESSLLAEVVSLLERLSKEQHRLARDYRILIQAATRLRLGKSGEAVLADIREQSPESAAGRLRPPAHAGHSPYPVGWSNRRCGLKADECGTPNSLRRTCGLMAPG